MYHCHVLYLFHLGVVCCTRGEGSCHSINDFQVLLPNITLCVVFIINLVTTAYLSLFII